MSIFPASTASRPRSRPFAAALPRRGAMSKLVVPAYGGEAPLAGIRRVPGRPVPGDAEDVSCAGGRCTGGCRGRRGLRPDPCRRPSSRTMRVSLPPAAPGCRCSPPTRCSRSICITTPRVARRIAARSGSAGSRAASAMRSTGRRAIDGDARRLADYGVTAPMHVLPTGIPLQRFGGGDGEAFRARHGIRPGARWRFRRPRGHEKRTSISCAPAGDAPFDARGPAAGHREGPALPALRAQVEAGDRRKRPLPRLSRSAEGPAGLLCRRRRLRLCLAHRDAGTCPARGHGVRSAGDRAFGHGDERHPRCRRGCLVPRTISRPSARRWPTSSPTGRSGAICEREAREYAREWSDAAMAERLASLYRELRRSHRAAHLERLAIGGI